MKKSIEVTHPQTYYRCDDCECEYQTNSVCYMCGKDICQQCRVFDDADDSDYPTRYCKQCWHVGKKYRRQMNELEFEYEETIDKLHQRWKDEALTQG